MRIRINLALAVAAFATAFAGGGPTLAEAATVPLSQDVTAVTAQSGTTASDPTKTGTVADTTPTSSSVDNGTATTSAFAPLAASATSGPTPAILPGLNQLGLGWTSGLPYPADQFGAIGPQYYVQGVTNTGIAVFRRSDLSMVAGPVPGVSFTGAPAGAEIVDAQFMWDVQTERFYYAYSYKKWTNNVRTAGLLYGWTKTSDPTDLANGWCRMRIDNGGDFDDRPKLGDNLTHLIIATNADPATGNDFDRVWTMPKPANGDTSCPASQTGVKIFGSTSQPLKTSDGDIADSMIAAQDNDGAANGWVVSADDRTTTTNQLMLWHVNSSGDLVADGNVAVSSFSDPPAPPQPDPYVELDPVDRRLNSAIADRDPDVGATGLWTSHTIADPAGTGRSIVRWYELLPGSCAPVTSGVCSSAVRRQQGEVKDPTNWLFNAAIAPTDVGNEAVLHYDSASKSQLVQVRARSRVSNTPLGSLGDEATIETSDAVYDEPTCHDSRLYCRWGDYAAATTDPSDPHAVWGSNQAIGPTNGGKPNWKTRNFALQPTASPSLVHSATGAVDTGGDGDGVVEPGESFDLTETVRNIGGAGASGVSGTLASNTSGLTVTGATSPYPNVGAGGTGTNSTPFGASLGSSFACGMPLSMTLTIDTAQGRYHMPLSLPTGSAGAPTSTNATDLPKAIPDNNATGVTSSVVIGGSGRIADLDVSISRITHTWDGDLRLQLTGPDGTTVLLADRPGGVDNGGDNFVNTVFDDEATTALSAGAAPYTGSFRPQGRLSAFDGKQLNGTWTLRVADLAVNDTGSLVGWGTRLSPSVCDVSTNAPPAAGFSASPQPAVTGQTITFTSTSSDPDGSISSQAWDLDNDGAFDDGTGTSASRSFAAPGTYTVKLRVTDDKGASSVATRTVTIDNRPPSASFTSSPASPVTGQSVSFSSTSTDPDGSVAAYAWDLDNDGAFDDGTTATASKTFAKSGSYTVRLRVTDDLGATSTASRTVTVDNRPPSASFTYSPSSPLTSQAVNFTSTSSDPDGTIAATAWDLDNDGAFDDASGSTASRTFATPGTYTVRLQATDDEGLTNVTSQTVTVGNRGPAASFTSTPASPSTGDTVTVTSTSSDPDGTIASQAWDLDNDGAYDDGTGAVASTTFAKTGTYTIGLKVTDNSGASATTSKAITVANRSPSASFTFTPTSPVTGQAVSFTSTSTDSDGTISAVAWDLDNDGLYDNGTTATATKSFAKAGTYTVGLRVTDDDGGMSSTTKTVTVANRPPTASFTSSPASPVTGQSVSLTSTSTDPDGSVAAYAWDLDNDGAYDDATGATASRSFAKSGTYTVGLKVTDDDGGTATTSKTITVSNRPPNASFSTSPPSPVTSQAVSLTSTSADPDGSISATAWDLDNDGAYDDATGATASRSFAKSGTYTVGMKVTDDEGATATTTKAITVANRAPNATFTSSPSNPVTGQSVSLTSTANDPDGSISATAWDLDNDGAYDDATTTTASKSFAKAGTYTVGLKVTDDEGATSTKSQTITVANRPPSASFTSSPSNPLTGQAVSLTSTSSDPDGSITATAWDLDNDGAYDDATGTAASRSFAKAGTYTIGLKVTDDNGGTATTSKTVTVANRKPVPALTVSPDRTSTLQTVTFDSNSTDPDGTVTSQAWDLDNDGAYDDGTGAEASKSFGSAGTYTVGLKVTDDDGGSATTTGTVTIDNQAPTAKFSFAPDPVATGDPVTFTSESTDPDGHVDAQAWDLDGDGKFDDGTAPTATRAFPKSGPHVVHLRVTDSDGGTSTATKTVSVAGRAPVASFTVAPESVAVGEPSSFDAAPSSDPDGSVVRYQWDLDGDGTFETDTGTSPTTSRFWGSAGNVIVGLRVTDDDGLTNETQRTVTVTEAPFADNPDAPPPDTGPLPGTDPGDGGGTPVPQPQPQPEPQPGPKPKPPHGSLRVLTHKLSEARRRGLAVRFSSSAAATAQFRVLSAGGAKLGSLNRLVGAGRSSVRVKLKHRPGRRVTVKMTLIDAAGLKRTYAARISLH